MSGVLEVQGRPVADKVVGYWYCEREVRAYKQGYITKALVNNRTVIQWVECQLWGC